MCYGLHCTVAMRNVWLSTSKATATRDLTDLLAKGLLRVEGVGKATRYAVNVPGWMQPVVKG